MAMAAKANAVANSVRHEQFEPKHEWVRGDRSETVLLHLAGFKMDNLKVMLISSGNIQVEGERYLDSDQRRWFKKVFNVPENCNQKEIRAIYEGGILSVIFPKITGTNQTSTDQKSAAEPTVASAAKSPSDQQKNSEEHNASTVAGQVKGKLAAAKEAISGGAEKLQEKLAPKKAEVDNTVTAADDTVDNQQKTSTMTGQVMAKLAAAKEAVAGGAGKLQEKLGSQKTGGDDSVTTANKIPEDQQKTSTVAGQVKTKLAAVKEAISGSAGTLQEKLGTKKTEVDEKKDRVGEAAGGGAGKLREKMNSTKAGIAEKQAKAAEEAEAAAGRWREKMTYKKSELADGISKRKTPLVNVVAVVVVLVGIGLYVYYYKFKRPTEKVRN